MTFSPRPPKWESPELLEFEDENSEPVTAETDDAAEDDGTYDDYSNDYIEDAGEADDRLQGNIGCYPTSPPCNPSCRPNCHPACRPNCNPSCRPNCNPACRPNCNPTCKPACQPTCQPVNCFPVCRPRFCQPRYCYPACRPACNPGNCYPKPGCNPQRTAPR